MELMILFVCVYLLGLFPVELQSFTSATGRENVLCGYTAQLDSSLNSNCTGTINITIRLPPGFWGALTSDHNNEAFFEIDTVFSSKHQTWNVNCRPENSDKCLKEIRLVHPIANKIQEFRVAFTPKKMPYYRCTEVPLRERCFLKPELTTAKISTTVSAPAESPLWWILVIICIFISFVTLGALLLLHKRSKRHQSINTNLLKILLLDLSDNSGHLGNELQPLTTCTSFAASLKSQLEGRCELTVVNSHNTEYSYLNNDDYAALTHSNDAFIIIPSVRMVPTGEDEELQLDVQVTVNILRHLQYCRERCVFVCCKELDHPHRSLTEKYTHFRNTPVYTFKSRNLTSPRNKNILNKLLQYLLDKDFRPMNNI